MSIPVPVIRLEIEGMRHTLKMALDQHSAKIDADLNDAIEKFCSPENIRATLDDIVAKTLKSVIQEEVISFFRYGAGRETVAAAVKERLLRRETYTPIDEAAP